MFSKHLSPLRGRFAARAMALAIAGVTFGAVAVAPTAASAAAYVGAALKDLKAEEKVVVAHPQPVQVIFSFHTKGAPNARATKELKDEVMKAVTASGLFSTVSEQPVANGAILNIVIDNVIDKGEMAKAEGQGFVTGATFFVAGSNVTDHYVSTLDYVANATAAKITRSAKQSIIVQMGLINSAPQDAVKIGGMRDAVYTMTRQVVSVPLNDIARDPGFTGEATAAAVAAPAATPAPTATPAPAAAPAAVTTPQAAPAADPAPKA